MLENTFGLTKTLSDQLQATDLDLASTIDLVFALVDTLKEECNGETQTQVTCVREWALTCSANKQKEK